MQALLYGELVPWYRLIDPTGDHEDEATAYGDALSRAVGAGERTLLELGAGAGNNAFFMKRRFRSTLTDVSDAMLGLSRETNPECEHLALDMRLLRLERTFDAVFVHDAVMYMTSAADLGRVAETAFVHTRPGGAALFAPDYVKETFREKSELHQGDDGRRSLRCLEWTWDPDVADETFRSEYAFLLRDGTDLRAVHDCHVEGLFPRATWLGLLEAAGFRVELVPRAFEDDQTDEMFLCRRPAR